MARRPRRRNFNKLAQDIELLTQELKSCSPNTSGMVPSSRRRKSRRRGRGLTGLSSEIVEAPAAGSMIIRRGQNIPRINTLGSATYVRNTEPVVAITTAAAGAFATVRDFVAPFSYPWISAIAISWSKWRFHYLRFIYVPQCATTTPGNVVLSIGYDYSDANPASLVDAQLSYNSVSGPLWGGYGGSSIMNQYGAKRVANTIALDVDVTRLGVETGVALYRYCTLATFSALSNPDRNIYSPCYVDFSTAGGPTAATTVGTIFVEYVIELIEPISGARNA